MSHWCNFKSDFKNANLHPIVMPKQRLSCLWRFYHCSRYLLACIFATTHQVRENLNLLIHFEWLWHQQCLSWNHAGLSRTCDILLSRRVLEKLGVDLVSWQLHVSTIDWTKISIWKQAKVAKFLPHDRAADEAILDAEHVRVLFWVRHADVCELNVEVLIHAVQGAGNATNKKF